MTKSMDTERVLGGGPIVVGVDGSESSREAIAWAAEYARNTGARLVAVTSWDWPSAFGYLPPWPEDISFEEDARRTLEESIEKVLGAEGKDKVKLVLLHGHPSPALLEYSKAASLIVVGSRGHGEFAGMLLGSVSEYLATHAHCPVVIVRHGG